MTTKPDILNYTDFRKYLRDLYDFLKETTPYFSYRYFSKMAGFSSPNFYKLVADNKRNISADAIERFTKALKLDVKEARYFRLLVLMNQAATPEERDYFMRQLLKTKGVRHAKPLSEAQYDYYSQWYHIPLRELVARSDFKNDPKWIADQFTPPLSEKEVREGLVTLKKLGLVSKTSDGQFVQSSNAVTTGDDVTNVAVANYHRQMIQMGSEALERFKASERDVSSLTMGMSKATAAKVRKMIREFRKEIIAVVGEDKEVEDIVQFNMQLFPLSQKKKETP